jgi:tRNA(adenine34) deaminase
MRFPGGMRERPNRHAWKACVGQPTVGSNPTPSAMDDDAAMGLALEEAAEARTHGDVPIGCVVLVDGAVVARRHNERERAGDPTAHAEVLAVRDAAAAVGDGWRLTGATVVVTVEPCPMCAGAILAARAERVVFGAADPKAGSFGSLYNLAADPRLHHEIAVTSGVRAGEAAALVQAFFSQRREADR